MNASVASVTATPTMVRYRAAGAVIARFVARRTLKSASLWAFIFGCYTASKVLGYVKAAPTLADREKLMHSLGNTVGLNALLGIPHDIVTVAGYAAWNIFSIVTIIGSIWAFMLATKHFRGEEESGRSELLLAGPTTVRGAAAGTLLGISIGLGVQFLIVAVLCAAIGRSPSVNLSLQSCLFFALSLSMGTTLFIAVGALTSQLMPTRSRAASLAALVFGLCFLCRAMADVTGAHWLLDVTPLGWIERLRPLTGSSPVWLLPVLGLAVLCAGLSVRLAGRRDLGDSTFADRDTARPHIRLLNTTLGAALRLTRGATLVWLLAISLMGVFYGLLTKTATQALSSLTHTGGSGKVINGLEQGAQLGGEKLFLGAIFLIIAPLVMACAASAAGKIRDEEGRGFLDNLLVGPTSRGRWLAERLLLAALVVAAVCLLAGLSVWLGAASQHASVALGSLIQAGGNMFGAGLFTLGAGVFTMGLAPRLTTLAAYSVIGWSFLVEILGSGLNFNRWLLDTSVLHHLTLAPAVAPNWTADAVLAGLAGLLAAIGATAFRRRDLQSE